MCKREIEVKNSGNESKISKYFNGYRISNSKLIGGHVRKYGLEK